MKEQQNNANTSKATEKVPLELFDWEKLPVEERKRRVKIRMQNLGTYKGLVIINNPKLRGEYS